MPLPLDEKALRAGKQYFRMHGRGVRRFVEDHLPQPVKAGFALLER
ncbi:hypothetical protein J2X68_007786 [Streptomyces sp. 3330]|nr:hypothetical protein [Streptomyces sp. 3330]MDR6981044.1 hypothetical protein [Streptomyces sp. 3330]